MANYEEQINDILKGVKFKVLEEKIRDVILSASKGFSPSVSVGSGSMLSPEEARETSIKVVLSEFVISDTYRRHLEQQKDTVDESQRVEVIISLIFGTLKVYAMGKDSFHLALSLFTNLGSDSIPSLSLTPKGFIKNVSTEYNNNWVTAYEIEINFEALTFQPKDLYFAKSWQLLIEDNYGKN